jgi:membrane-bound metal-dependent hydrolase YbcI (DUF457 family)
LDIVTHGLSGAITAKIGIDKKIGKTASLLLIGAVLFPDIDVVVGLFGRIFSLEFHRSFTHSLLGIPVIATIYAYFFYKFSSYKNYLHLYLLSILGMSLHVIFDLLTSYGTMILFPSFERYSFDLLFIIDLTLTSIMILTIVGTRKLQPESVLRTNSILLAIVLVVYLLLVYFLQSNTNYFYDTLFIFVILIISSRIIAFAVRKTNDSSLVALAGIVLVLIYLAGCGVNRLIAKNRINKFISEYQIEPTRIGLYPQPMSQFQWMAIIETDHLFYQTAFHNISNRQIEFEIFYKPANNRFIENSKNLDAVKVFEKFAKFLLVTYEEKNGKHTIEYTDLRFRVPVFKFSKWPVLQIVMDNNGRILSENFAR